MSWLPFSTVCVLPEITINSLGGQVIQHATLTVTDNKTFQVRILPIQRPGFKPDYPGPEH